MMPARETAFEPMSQFISELAEIREAQYLVERSHIAGLTTDRPLDKHYVVLELMFLTLTAYIK